MTNHIVVVEKRNDFRWTDCDVTVVTAHEFILGNTFGTGLRKVANLCRGYSYMSLGYYVSLLAEARGDRVTPSVETIVDMQQKAVVTPRLTALAKTARTLEGIPLSVNAMSVQVFFGHIDEKPLAELARKSFETFQCPLLTIELERGDGGEQWKVSAIRPLDPRDIDPSRDAVFLEALSRFTRRSWRPRPASEGARLDLAILQDPSDPMAPSNLPTLEAFARVGAEMDIAVELIDRRDIGKLQQFDALFIRETTAVAHHTFRFARKAVAIGMPAIDDPASILRCTNKAFLSELLSGNGVPTPRTMFVTTRTLAQAEGQMAYPVVLKVPDGAFSLAVKKAENRSEFETIAREMLRQSDIVLVQEFLYTSFDWRIGILAGQVIFAAKYFMYADHWQIIRHSAEAPPREGKTEAIPVIDVPNTVKDVALAAAKLVGDGLYGVDLKQTADGVVVIEVNDNPNINLHEEGQVEGDTLLRTVLLHFQTLVEARHRIVRPATHLTLLPASQDYVLRDAS